METKDIPGFPGYQATTSGDVISLKGRTPRVLRPYPTNYLRVSLRRDGKTIVKTVHSLIALTFIGEPPPGEEVRHANGKAYDNRLENLSYAPHWVNQRDQLIHGTNKEARKTHCAQGHPYSENTMNPTKNRPNARRCRKCHVVWIARWRAKKRAEKLIAKCMEKPEASQR